MPTLIPELQAVIARLINPPTPATDKLAALHKSWQDEEDDHVERCRLAGDDEAAERRAAAERGEE